MTGEILTLKDVAALLQVAEKTVYTMAQRREIPCFKVRGQWRFRRQDLEIWFEALSLSEAKPSSLRRSSPTATLTADLEKGKTLFPSQPSSPQASSARIYLFSDYELDEHFCELRQAGQPVKIEPKVFDVLCYLLHHRDRVVSRKELLKQLWAGQVVVEAVVTRCIAEARKAVRDDGFRQQLIKTQRGRGYRFVATITERSVSTFGRDIPAERLYLSKDNQPAAVAPTLPALTVLPFANLSGDPAQNYCSDALTEDLITDLAKLPGLSVLAGTSPFTPKSKAVKLASMERELEAQYVLNGSVRTAGKRMLITVQLADSATGRQLWVERYDRLLHDVFAVQEEVRRKIVVHLGLTLTDTDRWVVDREYTGNPEAFDAFWRGWESYSRFTQEGNAHARQLFERAVALDPMYAPAYLGLGWTYWLEWTWQWSQDPLTLERAFALAQKAKALDGSLASIWVLLGWIYLRQKRPEQALAEGKCAIALDPQGAPAYMGLSGILNCVGRPEEAVRLIDHAARLNSQIADFSSLELGLSYYLLRRYEEAIAAAQKALGRFPHLPGTHTLLAALYGETGQTTKARAEVDAIRQISPRFSLEVWRQNSPYKDSAMTERFLRALFKGGVK